MAPPGAANTIALVPGQGSSRAGLISLDETVPDPVPSQFFFRDLDGNRFLVVQPGLGCRGYRPDLGARPGPGALVAMKPPSPCRWVRPA